MHLFAFVALLYLLLCGHPALGQPPPTAPPSLDARIDAAVRPLAEAVSGIIFYAPVMYHEAVVPPGSALCATWRGEAPAGLRLAVLALDSGHFRVEGPAGAQAVALGEAAHIAGGELRVGWQGAPQPGARAEVRVEAVRFLPLIVLALLGLSAYFTVYFRFANVRYFRLALAIVAGRHRGTVGSGAGETSHFQALMTALSGTLGLGNIAGVALAIAVGGPGATVWMMLAGFLGMCTKMVECTLGLRYRRVDAAGVVSGGPMYYLQGIGGAGPGRALAVCFCVACVLGTVGAGNMFQVNQAYRQLAELDSLRGTLLADNGWLFGACFGGLTALVVIGGIRRIARVTDKLVPVMVTLYMAAGLVILGLNAAALPAALWQMLREAVAPVGIAGGMAGVMVQGFRRAFFSNEVGMGSAPIAHAAVRTAFPASEGIVALLEPFLDTVVVCTMTAVVIVVTGAYTHTELSGASLSMLAFAGQLPWFRYVLVASVQLFAFATVVAWSYYGLNAWLFLFGHTTRNRLTYNLLYCAAMIPGAAASVGNIVNLADALLFSMAIPNMVGMVVRRAEVREELRRFLGSLATRPGTKAGEPPTSA